MKPRWLLEAGGAALLLLLPDFCPLVLPRNIAFYHHRLPVTNIVGGVLLDLLGAAIAGAVLIVLLSRLPAVPRRVMGACLAALVCWRAAGVFSIVFGLWNTNLGLARAAQSSGIYWAVAHFWNRFGRFSAYGLILLFVALAWFKAGVSARIVRATRFSLAAFSFCAIWIVPKLVGIALAQPVHVAPVQASIQPQSAPGRRIIWLLFDELSYNLLFDHHPPGLPTPNFQHLYSTSISFGNLDPVGYYTDRVIPSLLLGSRFDQIASTSAGKLLYLDESNHRWEAYDPQHTLFALARSDGWNPGVAGWYIPYCRTFGSVLSACSWVPGIQEDLPLERDGASESKSALANALVLPEAPLARLVLGKRGGRTAMLDQNIRDYLQVMKNADGLIRDGNIRLIFVHLPVPHPPGFYNRRTHQLSASGDYLDNLVLADDTLGVLRQEINRTPWAGQTTLIVSSDHSWRVPLWRAGNDWTAEEERISQGRFDPRPVFIIHFPGQDSGREIQGSFSELIEHKVVAGMLTNEVTAPSNLQSRLWLPVRASKRSDRAPFKKGIVLRLAQFRRRKCLTRVLRAAQTEGAVCIEQSGLYFAAGGSDSGGFFPFQ